jgi:hypothetical protein
MKFRLRPGSVARAEDLVGACVRECAAYVAVRPENGPLVAAIGALVVEYARRTSRTRTGASGRC